MLDIKVIAITEQDEENSELDVLINGKVEWESGLRSSRPLYIVDDYVIKFDSGTDFFQSSDEIELWGRIEEDDRKYFAPILQCQHHTESEVGIGYVVQPYLQEKKFFSADEKFEAYDEAWELIQELCVKYHLIDLYAQGGNYMITEEGPVIYDYGV